MKHSKIINLKTFFFLLHTKPLTNWCQTRDHISLFHIPIYTISNLFQYQSQLKTCKDGEMKNSTNAKKMLSTRWKKYQELGIERLNNIPVKAFQLQYKLGITNNSIHMPHTQQTIGKTKNMLTSKSTVQLIL